VQANRETAPVRQANHALDFRSRQVVATYRLEAQRAEKLLLFLSLLAASY